MRKVIQIRCRIFYDEIKLRVLACDPTTRDWQTGTDDQALIDFDLFF